MQTQALPKPKFDILDTRESRVEFLLGSDLVPVSNSIVQARSNLRAFCARGQSATSTPLKAPRLIKRSILDAPARRRFRTRNPRRRVVAFDLARALDEADYDPNDLETICQMIPKVLSVSANTLSVYLSKN
jgi:hypothetical protein